MPSVTSANAAVDPTIPHPTMPIFIDYLVLVHVRPDSERLHISKHDGTLLQDAGLCKFAKPDL